MATKATRMEHDLLGDKAVPADAYYGVQTARALENFHISGVELRLYPNLIKALAMVKLAAARANFECEQFGKDALAGHGAGLPGDHRRQAPRRVPARRVPGRAGTSTNMNANEVIANRALGAHGPYQGRLRPPEPHDHVNCSQSTNDAYPTGSMSAWLSATSSWSRPCVS